MVCIYCGSKTQVINSRLQKRLNHTWRRRECTNCHAVFTTEEAAELRTGIAIRTAEAETQPFSRDRLFVSLLRALGHRTTSLEDASALAATIIAKLLGSTAKAIITSSDITQATYDTLRHFDEAAAVHYRAYHKRYL